MVQLAQNTQRQEAKQEVSVAPKLPNTPIPENNINFSNNVSGQAASTNYNDLLSSTNLPANLTVNGKLNIGYIELPKSLNEIRSEEQTLLGANAILSSAIRGYQNQSNKDSFSMVIIAPYGGDDLKLNVSAVSAVNVKKLMTEAFGSRLGAECVEENNKMTFKLDGGAKTVVIYRYSASTELGKGSEHLVKAANQTQADAMIVVNTTDGKLNTINTINDTLKSALTQGVQEILKSEIPWKPLISSKDLAPEKFEMLQAAYKMGYRIQEDAEGKLRVVKISASGKGEEVYKLETNSKDPKQIAEQIYNLVSKLVTTQPIPIIGKENVTPIIPTGDILKLEGTSYHSIREGYKKGFVVEHIKTENNVESYQVYKVAGGKKLALGDIVAVSKTDAEYLTKRDSALADAMIKAQTIEIKPPVVKPAQEPTPKPVEPVPAPNREPVKLEHNGQKLFEITEAKYPDLYKLIKSGDLKLESVEGVKHAYENANLSIFTYDFKYQDINGVVQSQKLLLSSSNNSPEALQALANAFIKQLPIEIMATYEADKVYMVPVALNPKDAAVLSEARSIGYEIVDLGNSPSGRIYGLKNLTSYELKETEQKGNFQTVTGKIDMSIVVPNANVDGELKKILDQALSQDAEKATLRAQNELRSKLLEQQREMSNSKLNWHPDSVRRLQEQLADIPKHAGKNIGGRQTEYLTRRKTNNLVAGLIDSENVYQLMKFGAGLINEVDQETSRQNVTAMDYRYADALGQVLSKAALRRGMGEDFAEEIKRADMAILDTLSIAYLKAKPQVEAMLTTGPEDVQKIEFKERMERFALAVAKIVIEKRHQDPDQLIFGPKSRIVAILGGDKDFSADAMRKTFQHYGADSNLIYTNKDSKFKNQDEALIQWAASQNASEGSPLIYIWGHASSTHFTHIELAKIAKTVVQSVKPTIDENGQKSIDLGHLSFCFEGCHVGAMGGGFYEHLEKAAKNKGIVISSPPNMYSSVQRGEYSNNSISRNIATVNGIQRDEVSLSLFQESMLALPSKSGMTRKDMFDVAEIMQQRVLSDAENFRYHMIPKEASHMSLDIGKQSPAVLDYKSTTIIDLFKEIETKMNSEQGAPRIRLAPPTDQEVKLQIHLTGIMSNTGNYTS